MAKIELSPLLEGIRGQVESLVFRRCANRTVVQQAPDMTRLTASPAQRAQRERFRQAVAHGRALLADPAVRARYAARAREEGKSALLLCVRDYLRSARMERRMECACAAGAFPAAAELPPSKTHHHRHQEAGLVPSRSPVGRRQPAPQPPTQRGPGLIRSAWWRKHSGRSPAEIQRLTREANPSKSPAENSAALSRKPQSPGIQE